MRTSTLLLVAPAVFAGVATAQDERNTDKIYLTDGSVLKDVGVTTDGVLEVEYRSGRNKTTVPSERVLRIEFGAKPRIVDQADGFALQEEYLDAITEMQNYLGEVEEKPDKRFPWAAAYARYRLIELNGVIGELDALGAAADELIAKHPDSRFAPLAFVAKAQALSDAGNAAGAKAAADAFGKFVGDKQLTGRWVVEQNLWAALTSGESGKKQQDALAAVAADAAEFPSVRNRAEVAIAESLLGSKKVAEAEKVFRDVVKESKADTRTMAAAWTGLGDTLYARAGAAAAEEKPAIYKEALKAYMRPVVVYPDESAYVSKAAFFAGRCYQELGDTESMDRSRKLYKFVINTFPGSRWDREARSFYK